MKKQSLECKDNNAATVKGMMPSKVWIAMWLRVADSECMPVIAGDGWQKQLDNGLEVSIIIFTVLLDSFQGAHGRQECQTRNASTTGDFEPSSEACPRRAISSGRFFRSARSDPGQVRDAAPSADRRPVCDGRIGELRFFTAIFLPSVIGLRARRTGRPGAAQARSEQAHKLTEEVLTFIGEMRQKEPSVGLPDLVKLIQDRFGIRVHPRSIERSLLRHQNSVDRAPRFNSRPSRSGCRVRAPAPRCYSNGGPPWGRLRLGAFCPTRNDHLDAGLVGMCSPQRTKSAL